MQSELVQIEAKSRLLEALRTFRAKLVEDRQIHFTKNRTLPVSFYEDHILFGDTQVSNDCSVADFEYLLAAFLFGRCCGEELSKQIVDGVFRCANLS